MPAPDIGGDHGDHHGNPDADLDKGGFDSGCLYASGSEMERGVALANEVSEALGHGPSQGYSHGSIGDIMPGHPEVVSGNANNAREVIKPGKANADGAMIDVTWYFHGQAADPMEKVEKVARSLGLEQICPRPHQPVPPLGTGWRTRAGCIARTLKDGDEFNMPMGWYKGCKVTTKDFRRFYYVPRLRNRFLNWAALQLNLVANEEEWRQFIVVTGATWIYEHTVGDQKVFDCETRLSFLVNFTPEVRNGLYMPDWTIIREHREEAEKMAHSLLMYLRAFPGDPLAYQARLKVPLADFTPPRPPKIRRSRSASKSGPAAVPSTWEPDRNPTNPSSTDFDNPDTGTDPRRGSGGGFGGVNRRD